MRRIVIAGAGLAGHRAAVALRKSGFDGDVTIVGDEAHRPYDRPPLSKQLLGGSFSDDDCFFSCDEIEDVTWKLGAAAASVDPDAGILTLEGGGEVEFDGLLIATGRRARELPGTPQLDGIHTMRTIDDSKAFKAAVEGGARVVIIGAGFIGCEVAATLRGLGVDDVSVVDVAAHPMPVLGKAVGERAATLHSGHGVKLHLAAGVAGIDGDGKVETVRLENGESLPADVVLSAVGSAPNTEWLDGSGLEIHQGTVLCRRALLRDRHGQRVAAGDVAVVAPPARRRRLRLDRALDQCPRHGRHRG